MRYASSPRHGTLLTSPQLVLIDAGCEYAHYTSDITRTFPVSGKFTEPQKDLYEAVLNVQKECLKKCTVEEQVSMAELHRLSEYDMAAGGQG
jgi:intermediate cleaving peptidase 55